MIKIHELDNYKNISILLVKIIYQIIYLFKHTDIGKVNMCFLPFMKDVII